MLNSDFIAKHIRRHLEGQGYRPTQIEAATNHVLILWGRGDPFGSGDFLQEAQQFALRQYGKPRRDK